ncbi:hypothetical protein FWD20_01260 [Candidatus Saccharibacteria bacterium]|nr:hypothetical protein [Candidatus Saccharibacteria bacterium]
MSKQFKNDDISRLYLLMMKEFESTREDLGERMDRVEHRLDGVEKTLDHLIGQYTTLTDEQAAIAGAHVRIDDALDNHEKRIGKIEELQQQAA